MLFYMSAFFQARLLFVFFFFFALVLVVKASDSLATAMKINRIIAKTLDLISRLTKIQLFCYFDN